MGPMPPHRRRQKDRPRLPVAAIGADRDVAEAVAIDVPGQGNAVAGIVIGRRAVDPDPLVGAEIAKVHVLAGGLPSEDQIDGAGIGPAGVVVRRGDEDVVEAVAVDVAGGGDGKPGPVVGGIAEDLEAVGRVKIGEVDRFEALRPAEDPEPRRHYSLAVGGRAENEVVETVAVDVAGVGQAAAEPVVTPAEQGGTGGAHRSTPGEGRRIGRTADAAGMLEPMGR